jgi:putative DNA primase/helicase
LTQPFLNIRILGQSENRIIVLDAFLCATGNNLRLAGDMTRRALLCTLDPGCERPELREFDVDPIETVKANRARYVHGVLTLLRAYHVAGRVQKVSPTGSFEGWSQLVRAVLLWLGEADPWMTTEAVRGGDPKLEALIAVIEQWRSVIGPEPVSVRALIDRVTKTQQTGGYLGKEEFAYPAFREALLAVAGRGGAINGQALGNWLGRNRGRIVAGFKLERHGIVQGNTTWKLVKA